MNTQRNFESKISGCCHKQDIHEQLISHLDDSYKDVPSGDGSGCGEFSVKIF
jgi:hypothetical protein